MRLLEITSDGALRLTKDLIDNIPAYAILSHTWALNDEEEVTFEDLNARSGKNKPGYKKLVFCQRQAAHDGLRFFWVDTCCINKRSDPELSEAINSMFRWYKKAVHCYVYLSDVVGTSPRKENTLEGTKGWESAFRNSRWFTRGWTLQELIAPRTVKFYNADGELLGDKFSLVSIIRDITGIAEEALQGHSLSTFSVEDKLSWTAQRSTRRAEDAVYSLLGLFEISMPLVYGEGRENAYRRLRREIDESSKGS